MLGDTGAREPPLPVEDLWRLPDIVDVEMHRVRYTRPRPHAVGARIAEAEEAVEFLVRTSEDFPIRALGPALFVGGTEIIESERLGDRLYRFTAYDGQRLRRGAALALGWSGQPGRRQRSQFRYQPGEEVTRSPY